jgi:hypothetical protein
MHRVTNESGLTDSADGSIAKDAEPLRSTMKESATLALTNSAFSWKFGSEVPEDVAWIDERFVRVRQCSGGGLSRAHEAILRPEGFRIRTQRGLPRRTVRRPTWSPPRDLATATCGGARRRVRDWLPYAASRIGSDGTRPERGDAEKAARGRVPWAEFVRGDAFRMPFAEDSFDRVFASFFYGLLPLEDRGRFLEEARRVGQELILVEPTPAWVPDGSRYEIYRRYFTADRFAEELDGRILFAGRWMVMAKVGG